jgi:hypothetical protein
MDFPRQHYLRPLPEMNGHWNAYCAYFFGPDDEVWELYAWRQGGGPGKLT